MPKSLIEYQIKEILFNKFSDIKILGKQNFDGSTLFPSSGALNPGLIATKLGSLIYNKNQNSGNG